MSIRKIVFLAVAGFIISPALMAANIVEKTKVKMVGAEFLDTANADNFIYGDELVVKLGADYTVGDIMTLGFSGAALDVKTLDPSLNAAKVKPNNGITFGLLSSTTSSAVYRVTAIESGDAGSTTVGVEVTISDKDNKNALQFGAQEVDAAGGVTVSFSAQTSSGLDLDTGGADDRSVEYIGVKDQFDGEVKTRFEGVIDVSADREKFESSSDDTAKITVTNDLTCCDKAFTSALVEADYTIFGDWGWVYDNDDTTPEVEPATGVFGLPEGCNDPEVTATELTFTCDAKTLSVEVKVDTDANRDPADPTGATLATLPGTSFTTTVAAKYDGFKNGNSPEGSVNVLSNASAGRWKLNGFQADLPYMPYGSSITQVIYLVNRGARFGDITVEWVDQNGNSGSLGVIATLLAGTTLSVGPTIRAALPTAQRTSGRLGLTITASVPAADVQINSQYNVSGNRAFVLHEDNRPDDSSPGN